MCHLVAGSSSNRVYYWAEAFRDPTVENHDVSVRYDPFDIGTAYAFVRNRWTECHSEHYTVLQGRSEREIMLASKSCADDANYIRENGSR